MKSTLAAVTFVMVVLALSFGLSNWASHNVQAAGPAITTQTASISMSLIGGNGGPMPGSSFAAIGGNGGPMPGSGKTHGSSLIGGNGGPMPGSSFAAIGGNGGPMPGSSLR